jgi:uncharacterized LabA/DUF88 family protein
VAESETHAGQQVQTDAGSESQAAEHRPRHKQQRQQPGKAQKAQEVPAVQAESTVTEPAPESAQSEAITTEIALEDLPPLEYSELQAATSRRRRRRRPSSSAPVTPAAPSVTPGSPSSAPSVVPYSIQSGFTVGQMNQGNDTKGPFMGPEPSPARGSVIQSQVRPLRTGRNAGSSDVGRGITPTQPVRPGEGIISNSGVNHLSNVITQAIQMQTDRMAAELRRVTQGPTNVSVSMPPFPSTERVGVFVDVANLLYSARNMRINIDFGKLLDFLRGNRRLVRAHAYAPTSPQPGEDQMFLQAVKGLGYRITTKNYKTFASGARKADLDLDLCMDVVRLVDSKAVDSIVLVSGDSDFMPMLDYCSDHGVRVEIAAFDESMSATLRQSCDLFINLAMLEEIRA